MGAAHAIVASQSLGFPGWLRLSHYLNLLFMVFLVRSGIEILMSHPRLYWNDGCTPGSEWLKFTKKKVPTDPDVLYTAREDEVDVSPWLGMPGHKNLGIGRHWHGVTNSLWLLTGIVYVVLLFGTGEWRRLIPTSWDVFPRAWHSLTTYLSLQVPPLSEFQPYDALQQLTYAVVVFVLAPVMLVTGAAMSPAIAASFPWYIRLLGGRQVARSIHFLGMLAFTVFVVFHVFFVLVVHPRENLTNITLGGQPERLGLALAIAVAAVVLVVALNAWATWFSLRNRRAVQVALDTFEAPIRKLALHNLAPGQHYKESDISPYHWVNGAPPKPEEAPEYHRLLQGGWREWRLEVGGLVGQPLSLCWTRSRPCPARSRSPSTTACRDGAAWPSGRVSGWPTSWTWPGRYIKLTSWGLAQYAYGDKPLEPFYEVIDPILARHQQTILAYEFNDVPLPLRHGAPLRLRVETQLGYKMVKYLRSIELIEDYRTEGDGQGGSREDAQFFGRGAEI